jgi:hypothetical protein
VSLKRVDFAEFYASSRDDCLRAVLAVTGDPAAAEDLVAEAFARAWASWRTVGAHPAPRAWVMRTALNLRVSSWRRFRREVAFGDEDASRPAARAADRPGTGPVDPEIMAALAGLPERQRQVIALRIFLARDELTVLLRVLPAVEEPPERVDAPAWPSGVVLVDDAGYAVPDPQPQGTAEPGDARADDHDPTPPGVRPCWRDPGCAASRNGCGQRGGSCAAQDMPPGYRNVRSSQGCPAAGR